MKHTCNLLALLLDVLEQFDNQLLKLLSGLVGKLADKRRPLHIR
jgi:hypothetical protein